MYIICSITEIDVGEGSWTKNLQKVTGYLVTFQKIKKKTRYIKLDIFRTDTGHWYVLLRMD